MNEQNENQIATTVDELFVVCQLRNLTDANKFYLKQYNEEQKIKAGKINNRQICIIFGTALCVSIIIFTWLIVSLNELHDQSNSTT